ncbi:MAG: alanyl-tRNA editing protein [Hyphomicrobiaceae bacterium]|nr:MAG: alanyl-tRNA editing protein [Hyphomicrobiaceae bacterium]
MTETLFRTEPYARDCHARVVEVNDRGGIVLDRTVCYATAGGQPGDKASLEWEGGACPIATTVYAEDKQTIVHVPAAGAKLPRPGQEVRLALDWASRYRHMRVHSSLHLLCSLVPFPVTGGQIAADGGRLDFDIADMSSIDKAAIEASLNRLIAEDHPIAESWITEEEMAARPVLVRTMKVKPPSGQGRVRLIAIGKDGEIDLQPCGGTHVRSTKEIGPVTLGKIESKGKQNRRFRILLAS